MNLPFHIARRYLFSKKSHNAINVISMVSVCGVTVATMAMVVALSVFNGFSDMVLTMTSHFDPELKISPRYGKVFDPQAAELQRLRQMPEVTLVCEVLQDNAMVRYRDKQDIAVVKGVDNRFPQLVPIDSVLFDGRFALREDVVDYATLGIGLSAKLGVRAGFVSPLDIFAPKRNEPVNMANPASSFDIEHAFVGGIFNTNQLQYDESYVLVPLELARSLFRYEKEVSFLELRLADGVSLSSVKRKIKDAIGDNYRVEDRYEQQADSFKMMQIEKWVTFLIMCFILAIALFNVVGSLSMLMIEKQADIRTLRNMGADEQLIRRIFLFEGWMISGVGTLVGLVIGVALALVQQEFGLIRLGDVSEAFVIDAYPVHVIPTDLLAVFLTVMAMGLLAAWYTIRYPGRRWLQRPTA